MVYAGTRLTPGLSLRLGAGRIQALHGPLDANSVTMLLSYTYGVSAGD
jgi:hypothetical protein